MRKSLQWEIKPAFVCTCGARYSAMPEKCESIVGTEHVISHVENRDEGKLYVIREMPARAGVRWAVKLFAALINAGVKVPDQIVRAGMAGVALMGFDSISNLRAADAQDLLDELLACVQIVRDKKHPEKSFDMVTDDDVEEVATYFQLAREAFKLHVNFS